MATFEHFPLKLVSPSFDSKLMDVLMELNHLRKLELYASAADSTAPWMFFQLKRIFHLLESVGSARIEGNRTTISEYIEQTIVNQQRSTSRFSEIANIEQSMAFVEESISHGSEITQKFIRELHQLVVHDLSDEGDKTPGAYRIWQVEIVESNHKPPDASSISSYLEELIQFLNYEDSQKYDLIKIALVHHRFVWIHPFGNGNGRVVRLLTYALLIKYGFRVDQGQLLNPTAVFCNDREIYYQQLASADSGKTAALLDWCEYVLVGIHAEISKVSKLLDHQYLAEKILKPALAIGLDRGYINEKEGMILKIAVEKQSFKADDVKQIFPELTSRQVTHFISKLKTSSLIRPIKPGGREYYVVFDNNYLMRSLIMMLEHEKFVPPIN